MARPSSHRFSLILLIVGAVWLVTGLLVFPPILAAAYRGEGLALLQALLADYPDQPLAFFLAQGRGIAIAGALACAAMAGFAYLLRSPNRADRLVGTATPGAVGALRMLVCGVLLMSTLWEDLPSTALLPREMVRPMGLLQLFYLLPGFEAFVTSAAALAVFKAVTVVILLLGFIGWKTRWVLPLGAVCYLLLAAMMRQYAWLYHTGLIPLYLLVLLSFLPAADGWSMDRLVRLWRGEPVAPADRATRRYGWARYALWAGMALPYVAAGLSKVRNGGLFWWDAVNFKYILFYSTVRPMQFDFEVSLLLTSAPDVLFELMALAALLGEAFYGLVLFFRWARWLMPTLMLAMHIGILFLQNILFFDLIILQLIFFNFKPLREYIGERLAARWSRIAVAYAAAAPGHVRAVRVLRALDLFGRLTFAPQPGAVFSADYQGRTVTDAALVRLLARSVPAAWVVLPLCLVPAIARRLAGILIGTSAPAAPAAPVLTPERSGSPRLVLALTGVLLVSWTFRIEFFPFTGMQMFSSVRGPVVTYEIPLAHLRSGEVIPAPIEASIGAMADSRYRRVLQMAFDADRESISRAFVEAVARSWNTTAPPDCQITQMEIQQWEWNYEANPDHPTHGDVVDRRTYTVGR